MTIGCDNEFSPFAESSADESIVVNGFLDFNADTQFVRIQVVRREIERDASLGDGLTAVLKNINTGTDFLMTDSILTLETERKVHLFYLQEPVEAGSNYELEVTGINGGRSVHSTNLPVRGSFLPAPVENIASQEPIVQPIRLSDLDRQPHNVTVIYTVLRNGTGEPIEVSFPYDNFLVAENNGFNYTIDVRLGIDRTNVIAALSLPQTDATTVLQNISLSYELFSDEWSQESVPTDVSFFGSAATFDETWTLPDVALSALMYAVP